jgi:hypothetical protein
MSPTANAQVQLALRLLLNEPKSKARYHSQRFDDRTTDLVNAICQCPNGIDKLREHADFVFRATHADSYHAIWREGILAANRVLLPSNQPTLKACPTYRIGIHSGQGRPLHQLRRVSRVHSWCQDLERIESVIGHAIDRDLSDACAENVSDEIIKSLRRWRTAVARIILAAQVCHADGMRYLWFVSTRDQLSSLNRNELNAALMFPLYQEGIREAAAWFVENERFTGTQDSRSSADGEPNARDGNNGSDVDDNEFRDGQFPNGEWLTSAYVWRNYELSKSFLSRHGQKKRKKRGRGHVYRFDWVAQEFAIKKLRQEGRSPSQDEIKRAADELRKQRENSP